MKEMKILHLFPKLLSLYGEYGNVAVMQAVLQAQGYSVCVTDCEDGQADYDAYDMIYVGSGTEDNLLVGLKRLLPCSQRIKQSVASGKVWLATGNAMALFGKSVSRGETVPATGVFDYTTIIDDSKRFLGDVITADTPATLGFINTSCSYTGIETPLLELYLNKQLGNDKASASEGIRYKNFFGTQLIGPFLVKNPHYMELLCALMTEAPVAVDPDGYMVKAYQVACKELRDRAGLGAD